MNQAFWLLKIKALLHDPPDKPLDIRGHEGQAQRWARQLGITLSRDAFKKADWIASAADRLNFPGYNTIGGARFSEKPYLTHPLAGVKLNLGAGRLLPTQVNEAALYQAIANSLVNLPSDPQRQFLWLWRNWSTQIQQTEGNQLGVLWDLLPADTRIPDHSIWAHQALTSAIAATQPDETSDQPDETSDPDPAFLLFTIGPVQAFIRAARRTQDLWAGSYLLSYLNWSAIEVIAEAIGPDAVIFPNLYGQPLCDRWLSQKGIIAPPKVEDLILPSLPNRFFAIVPRQQGADLAKQAEEKLRSQWREITQIVKSDLERLFNQPPAWSRTWERQTENLFEIYWQVYPWRPQEHPIQDREYRFLEPHRPFLGERCQNIENLLREYAQPEAQGGGQYAPNIGAIYGELYFITEKALGSRKGLRNFAQVPETGEKSTLAGDRATLYDGIDDLEWPESDFDGLNRAGHGRRKLSEFWQDLAKKLQRQGRYEIRETGERLDAIELTKRCAWRSYFQEKLNIPPSSSEDEESEEKYELRFPSTSNIATASFKQAVIDKILAIKDRNADELCQALRAWIDAVYPISQGNRCQPDVIPSLHRKIHINDGFLKRFLRLDGRLLFPETYEREEEWFDADQNKRKDALRQLKVFLKLAQKQDIPKPRKYFAVLMMDGDNMGQWVSGDKVPQYQQVLHPDTCQALKNKENWQTILDSPRLMAPAVHGFISKALGDFSLKVVRHIVEYRYPGKLVYAGGDDVLALLPVDCALKVARELRAAFSGEVYTGEIGTDQAGTQFEVRFGDPQTRSGYLYLKPSGEAQARLFATMGHSATASTGIAIAHHTSPLDLTLNAVREAEKAAKKQEGRNAFSITFLKRSGEEMHAGAKWFYGKKEQPESIKDTIALLQIFQDHFAQDRISGKFPYILREAALTLSSIKNPAMHEAEIKRLLHRQQGKEKLTADQEKELAKQLAELVAAADSMQTDKNNTSKLMTFADLLVFTRFLAIAEGEDR